MQRLILAEYFKYRRTAVLWLVLLAGLLIVSIVSLVYLINIVGSVGLDENPWDRFLNLTMAANTIFVMEPYIILLISFMCLLEHQSNTWKFLYSLPHKRSAIVVSKLIMIVAFVLLSLLLYFVFAFLFALGLDFIYPEFEFRYYAPNWQSFLSNLCRLFISLLGVIGFQYWLSLRFKHIILPIGIGLLGFIAGFLLFASNSVYLKYFPYAFPMTIKKFNMVKNSGAGADTWWTTTGLFSITVFVCFLILSIYQVRKKNVA